MFILYIYIYIYIYIIDNKRCEIITSTFFKMLSFILEEEKSILHHHFIFYCTHDILLLYEIKMSLERIKPDWDL